MSARLQFKPQIKPSVKTEGRWVVTAPHEIRDRAYESLSILGDVLDRSGVNRTQFIVDAYPGYTSRQAYVFTTVFLYTVIAPISLEQFWKSNPGDMLAFLEEDILLPEGQAPISLKEMGVALSIRFANLAWKTVRDQFFGLNSGFNSDQLYRWWQEGLDAYRRLQFAKIEGTHISKVDSERRQKKVASDVEYLEGRYRSCVDTNKRIYELRDEAEKIRDDFGTVANQTAEGTLSWRKFQKAFNEASGAIEKISQQIEAIREGYDNDRSPAIKTLEAIKKITPVEEPAAKS